MMKFQTKLFSILFSVTLGVLVAGAFYGVEAQCGECDTESCPLGEHKVPDDGPMASLMDPHGGCADTIFGGECSNHGECSQTEEDRDLLAQIVELAVDQEYSQLNEVLQTPSEYVVFNSRRNAIQVLGCEGALAASIPLADGMTVTHLIDGDF